MVYRYYYNIDRGLKVDPSEFLYLLDKKNLPEFDVIRCIAIQNNIGRTYMMFTENDSPTYQKEFMTDCQTLIAKAADDLHRYVHDVQNQLKKQGFPVEFFNIKRKSHNMESNPFMDNINSEAFFDLSENNLNMNAPATFRPLKIDELDIVSTDKIITK